MFKDMCIDMYKGMCVDMYKGMCIDMCKDMCIDMRKDMCIDMCKDMCVDMRQTPGKTSVEICIDTHVDARICCWLIFEAVASVLQRP